jgi:hypothetical protein
MVWRDRGEPAVDIRDMHECLVHGTRGGIRAFFLLALLRRPQRGIISLSLYQGAATIAFAIRSGVNLVLLLARIKSLPKYVSVPCSARLQPT